MFLRAFYASPKEINAIKTLSIFTPFRGVAGIIFRIYIMIGDEFCCDKSKHFNLLSIDVVEHKEFKKSEVIPSFMLAMI